MQLASSLYKGGELIPAESADYGSSRELGLICPFCKESVFLVKSHFRGASPVMAAWRHYKISSNSAYCENRALSKEGKAQLRELQPIAQNQRLKLFNRRFWDIFKYKKHIPANLKQTCLRFIDEETLDRMVIHCYKQWHVDQILKALPQKINQRLGNPQVEEALRKNPQIKELEPQEIDEIVSDFVRIEFSVLRHKILCEVITWLGTRSALDSFTKLIYLSVLDCLGALPPPIHTQHIAEMALVSLALTDWEKAIASLEAKTRAIGFG